MNPDQPRTPREELELRVTSLLLGELPAAEAAAVREAIAKDPELAKLHDDLMQTIQLVRAVTAIEPAVTAPETPALKLSDERRKKLVTAFAIPPLKPEHRPVASARRHRFTLIELLVVVGFVAILAALLLPSLAKSKSRAQSVVVRSNLRQLEMAKQMWADDNKKSAGDAPTMEELKPYLGNRAEIPPVMGETYSAGVVGEPAFAEVDAKAAKGRLGRLPTGSQASDRVRLSAEGKLSLAESSDEILRRTGMAAPTDGLVTVFATDASSASGNLNEPPLTALTVTPPPSSTTIVLPKLDVNGDFVGGVVVGGSAVGGKDANQLGWVLADAKQEQPATRGFYDEGRGTARSDSHGNTPQIAAAAEPSAMFYRFSGGGGAGGGGAQPVPATPAPAFTSGLQAGDKVAVLRDIPTLGKAFQSGSSGANFGVTVGGDGRATLSTSGQANAQSDFFSAGSLGTVRGRSEVEFEAAAPRGGVASDSWFGAQPQKQGNLTLTGSDKRLSEAQLRNSSKESVADLSIDTETRSLTVDASAAAAPAEIPARRYGGVSAVTNSLAFSESRLESGFEISRRLKLGRDVSADGPRNAGQESKVSKGARTLNEPGSGGVISQDVVGYVNVPINGKAESSKSIVVESRGVEVRKSDESPAYAGKKRELEEAVRLGTVLNAKIATESIDVNLPRSTTVEVVDEATPAKEKSGTFGGLLAGKYTSTARVKIERDNPDVAGLSDRDGAQGGYDPYFVQTEQEVMRSDVILGKVVDELNLKQEWGRKLNKGQELTKQEATTLLKDQLEVGLTRGTSLAEIRVKSTDADEAAKLANAIAKTYRDHRLEQRKQLTLAGTQVLEERFKEQEQLVRQKQAELDALKQKVEEREPDVPVVRKASTNAPIPQPEVLTSENAYSTFSLNVSDVSFKLAMASLEQGQMPDVASVRSEEFINAFDYHDLEPPAGSPIAFAWERARYPFAHNRDLLRFSIKTAAAGRQAGRPLNIVLLLDNSGSMERADRVQIIREALRVLAGQLRAQDKLSVITFARTARLVTDGISGDKAGEVAEQVSGLTPQGGTNLEEAMNLAYQTAARHYLANGINRVVLLTDGAANLGDVEPDSLKQKVETQRKQGIALDCFGIGWDGFNDDLLEVLSRNGDGRYGFLNSPEEAATDFVGQLAGALKVAASDVKVQVEFNPKRATAYRQIGYAKHQLTKEQFRDNTVDAAEIAAQEAGNALYTVEVNPRGEGPICIVRARYKVPGTTTYRELEWLVPFNGNAPALEQASPAMRLAAGASAFSEWLVASPFAGEVTPDRLLGLLRGVPEAFGADSRPKRLEWMIRQAKSLEGK